MKKVLVAGAALLIAGSMVPAAQAEVNLSGDARVRYVGTNNYTRNYTQHPITGQWQENKNSYRDNFNSRIRVKLDAKSNGGAYMKVRMRFDDTVWNGQGWGASTENKNVWADYAYIGAPIGSVDVSGGRMPANFSKFFSWDARPTRVKADWKSGNLRIIGLFDIMSEFADNTNDEFNDNDFYGWGLVGAYKINDVWNVKGYARYHQDQRDYYSSTVNVIQQVQINNLASAGRDPGSQGVGFISVPQQQLNPYDDKSGFLGAINTTGSFNLFGTKLGFEGDLAYKNSDVIGRCARRVNDPTCTTGDDAWGGHAEFSMDMGALNPAISGGWTQNGYEADDDFGFIMIGAAEPITVINRIGSVLGDSWWVALTSNYAMSDRLKFAGNLVYYDMSADHTETGGPDVRGLVDAWEISGSATYTLVEGADLTYKIGYLDPSYDGRINSAGISDDGYFGNYVRLQIKF